MFSNVVTLTSLITFVAFVQAQQTGVTTRYWDCCKTSCAWSGKASVTAPVKTCNVSNNPLTDVNAKSGCDGGSAFACADNSPWAINDNLAYGFAAVNLSGKTEADWCCSCYKLTFTSGPASGKVMIVQATNTGGDVGGAQFDLMIPGGGVGIFSSGCTAQYGSLSGWGQTYGGVSSLSDCSNLPSALQAGCQFRFNWFKGSDNPNVNWEKVTCPATLAARTGCVRSSEGVVADSSSPASSSTTSKSTSTTSTTTTKMVTSTVSTTSTTTKSTTTTKATTTSKPTTSSTSTTTKKSSTTTSTASDCPHSASMETAKHWAQCGGNNWAGATTCEAPYTCQFQNPWYSQCL